MCFFLFFKLKYNYTHFPLFFLNFPILIIIVASVFSLIVVTHIYSLHKYINKIYSLSIVLLCVYDFPILNKELQATKEYRVHKKIVFPRKENTKWLPNRCIFYYDICNLCSCVFAWCLCVWIVSICFCVWVEACAYWVTYVDVSRKLHMSALHLLSYVRQGSCVCLFAVVCDRLVDPFVSQDFAMSMFHIAIGLLGLEAQCNTPNFIQVWGSLTESHLVQQALYLLSCLLSLTFVSFSIIT